MKKKILIALCALFVLTIALCTTAFAARVTECPFTVRFKYLDDVVVTKFEVTDVENMFFQTGKYENRIYYSFESDRSAQLELICYDAIGMPIKTLDFNTYSDYIDVPDTTATIELIPDRSFTQDPNSDTFFYCKYINAYAADGRVLGITDLQSPVYETVGWFPEKTVYADDGRTMKISPFLVDAYAQVGWYTYDAVIFRAIQNRYSECKAVADYQGIIDLVNDALAIYEGTDYASSLYAMRTDAMDCWRVASGSPLPVVSYNITENSIGTPEANIQFTNVSYKTISAFKIKFTCYNIFGNVEDTYYDYYYVDNTTNNPGETWTYTWTLYGADSVNTIKNIRLTEVVFSDGTKLYY